MLNIYLEIWQKYYFLILCHSCLLYTSNTDYLLNKYQIKASKKFGQNFLIDLNIIKKIVETTPVDLETCVIEIGPGIGALTEQLAMKAGKVICLSLIHI